jgi:gluconolactonase
VSALAIIRNELSLVAETDAHEGPVYLAAEHALLFTTVRRRTRVALKRLQLATGRISVIRADANVANGMTLDREGRLLICEQGTLDDPARIARLDLASGRLETVVDAVAGLPLNSPNDVVVAADGAIWFTDPSYGQLQGFRPAPSLPDAVYRFADGELAAVPWEFDKPNGLAFSPDGRTLYVSDNGAPHHLVAFDVEDGRARNGRVLAVGTPGHPDGLKVDAQGRIYASAEHGIQVFSPAGELLDELELPGTVTFCFGPPGLLYVTTDTAVWAVSL